MKTLTTALLALLFAVNCFAQEQKDTIVNTEIQDSINRAMKEKQYFDVGEEDAKEYKRESNKRNPNLYLMKTNKGYRDGFHHEQSRRQIKRIKIGILIGIPAAVIAFILYKCSTEGCAPGGVYAI